MHNLQRIIFLLLFLTLFSIRPVDAEVVTKEQEKNKIYKVVSNLMEEGNFKELELLSEQYKNNLKPSPSFIADYSHFYYALIEGSTTINPKNPKVYDDFLLRWKKSQPDSITLDIAKIRALEAYAWNARGTNYSSMTSQEKQDEYSKFLTQASEVINQLNKKGIKDPEFYRLMISVGFQMGADKATLAYYCYDYAKQFPTYPAIYISLATALLPRWGGSAKYLEAFFAHISKEKWNVLGEKIYPYVMYFVASYEVENLATQYQVNWDILERGCNDLIKDSPEMELWQNKCAFTAAMGDNSELAQSYFSLIKEDWTSDMQDIWKNRNDFDKWKKWATAEESLANKKFLNAVKRSDLNEIRKFISTGTDLKNDHELAKLAGFTLVKQDQGKLEVLKFLLDNGLDIHAKNQSGCSLLAEALNYANIEIATFLINKGLKGDEENYAGYTPLHQASAYGFLPILDLFFKQGINLNVKENTGQTALHIAAYSGQTEVVAILIKKTKIDVNAIDQWHQTALHYAAIKGYKEIVKLLLANGADKKILTFMGKSAADLAKANNHQDLIEDLQ